MRSIKLKQLLTSIFAGIVLLIPFSTGINSQYYNPPLPDAGDQFQVTSPRPDTTISGTIQINMNIIDNDKTTNEYSVGIYNSSNCNALIGNITSGSGAGNITIPWNTKQTQSSSNLADGEYCLKVCTVLLYNGNPYSACNNRRIKTLNNNKKPIITSNPTKTKYIQGESYTYQVVASDPDGDVLTYRLISTPGFLQINPNTGLITSNGPLTTNGQYGVEYTYAIGVTDNRSGEVQQEVTFTIYKEDPSTTVAPQPTPSPSPTPNPSPSPNPAPTPSPQPPTPNVEVGDIRDFRFVNIDENTIISTETYRVEWTWGASKDLVKSSNLEFSADGTNWNSLQRNIDPNETKFDWNVAELTNREYYLRMVISKADDTRQIETTNKFVINKSNTDGEDSNDALIISVSPEPNSDVTETRPSISGKLLPSITSSVMLDTFEISLDGRDIKELCLVNEESEFICELENDLDNGRHVVSVKFEDSAEKLAQREWTFTIVSEGGDLIGGEENSSDENQQSAILFVILIICIVLILLFVPWIIYTIWRRDSDQSVDTSSYTVNTTSYQPVVDDYSYPDVNINTNYVTPDYTNTNPNDDYLSQYGNNDFVEPQKT